MSSDGHDDIVPLTREQARSRRQHAVRAHTVSMKRLAKRYLAEQSALYPEDTRELRPRDRTECRDGPRPCPFVSCKYHLYLDVSPTSGAIKLNFPDLEVWDLVESCAIDVADRGAQRLEDVARLANVTRERVRQIENAALALARKKRHLPIVRELQRLADAGELTSAVRAEHPLAVADAEVA